MSQAPSPSAQPLRTALHDVHLSLGARMVEFAGWSMPVMYSSIAEEHHAVRAGCGMFDVSHMGRLRLAGADALPVLERACTRSLADAAVGRCRYSLACHESGGVMDDLIVTRFEQHWGVVCNASTRDTVVAHLRALGAGKDFTLEDVTQQTVMLALQGPLTAELAERLLPIDLPDLKRWQATEGEVFGNEYTVYRSGYTGEDGYEVVLGANLGPMGFKLIAEYREEGQPVVRPCGLGARDTLRVEAGLPLGGHELGPDVDPISAGLGWAVSLGKEFIGASALRQIHERGPARKLTGLRLEGKRIARQGAGVVVGGRLVGKVTSGTLSPTLGQSIAMAYVDAEHTAPGTACRVDLRGSEAEAVVVPMPFYKKA